MPATLGWCCAVPSATQQGHVAQGTPRLCTLGGLFGPIAQLG